MSGQVRRMGGQDMDMAEAWDAKADVWADLEPIFEPANEALDQALMDTGGVTAGKHVLDVACGLGGLARRMQTHGADVTATDISPRMVALAQARTVDLDLRIADCDEALEGGPWDAIVSRFGVFFFPDPAAWLKRAHEALKPDGRIALALWVPGATPLSDVANATARELFDLPANDGPGSHTRFGGPAGWMPLLYDAGFQDVSLRAVDVPTRFGSTEAAVDVLKRLAGDLSGLGNKETVARYWRLVGERLPVRDGMLTARAAVVSARRGRS